MKNSLSAPALFILGGALLSNFTLSRGEPEFFTKGYWHRRSELSDGETFFFGRTNMWPRRAWHFSLWKTPSGETFLNFLGLFVRRRAFNES